MLDHVCAEKPLPHEFLLAWRVLPIDERAAFRKILEDSPCPAQREQAYIEEGLMESCRPGDGFFQYFSKLVRTPHEASLLNAAGRWIDLANPAITPEAVRELAETPDIPRSSLAALAANPNFPKDLFLKVLTDNICFQVAYCKHGNFKDKSAYGPIERDIVKVHHRESAVIQTCRKRLVERTAPLPRDVVRELDKKATRDDYVKLSKSMAHREFVRDEFSAPSLKEATKEGYLCLSPEFTSGSISSMFAEISLPKSHFVPEWRDASARLACHPNATPDVMQAALKNRELWPGILEHAVTSGSPHAALALSTIIEAADDGSNAFVTGCESLSQIQNCPQEALMKAYRKAYAPKRKSVCLDLASNRNFPHEELMVSDVDRSDKSATFWMSVIVNLAGKTPAPLPMHEKKAMETASLFNPKLSALKLCRIASEYPDLAPLAALHPNGVYDVRLPCEHPLLKAVEGFNVGFAPVSVAARSSKGTPSRPSNLQL